VTTCKQTQHFFQAGFHICKQKTIDNCTWNLSPYVKKLPELSVLRVIYSDRQNEQLLSLVIIYDNIVVFFFYYFLQKLRGWSNIYSDRSKLWLIQQCYHRLSLRTTTVHFVYHCKCKCQYTSAVRQWNADGRDIASPVQLRTDTITNEITLMCPNCSFTTFLRQTTLVIFWRMAIDSKCNCRSFSVYKYENPSSAILNNWSKE
jgi:hypothetical protein